MKSPLVKFILIVLYSGSLLINQQAECRLLSKYEINLNKHHEQQPAYYNEESQNQIEQEIEGIVESLNHKNEEFIKSNINSNELMPIREKKNKYLNAVDSDTQLSSFVNRNTCSTIFKQEANLIIDSKNSIDNGATLLDIKYLPTESTSTKLGQQCIEKCCDTDQCDSALLSMKPGTEGHRCYLFKCEENCLFVKHADYIVLRMRTPEQLNMQATNPNPTTSQVVSFDNKIKNDFNLEMQNVNSQKNTGGDYNLIENVLPENKIYFINKDKAVTSSSNMMLAIFLLVLGISIVIMLFSYLILSTKYVNRRLNKLQKRNNNVDVDADYLINGMYL